MRWAWLSSEAQRFVRFDAGERRRKCVTRSLQPSVGPGERVARDPQMTRDRRRNTTDLEFLDQQQRHTGGPRPQGVHTLRRFELSGSPPRARGL